MNIKNIKYYDIANGPGVRLTIFVSGCDIHCPGCFNKEAWDFNSGIPLDEELTNKIINELKKDSYSGISILGGEPLANKNLKGVYNLIKKIRKEFKKEKSIWLYTGSVIDKYLSSPYNKINISLYEKRNDENIEFTLDEYKKLILMNIDYIVDGPFIEKEKDISLVFRGSRNQRILFNNSFLIAKEGIRISFNNESEIFDKKEF